MTRSDPDGGHGSRDRHTIPVSGAGVSGGDPVDLDAPPGTRAGQRAGSNAGPARRADVGGVLRLGDLADLPASVSLLDAARALGIGRTSAYNLARQGQFPCPLIKIGALYRVPTAGLLRLLALTPTPAHIANNS